MDKEKYIKKDNEELICRLIQRQYDERIIKLVEKRLRQLNGILKSYEDDEIDNVYMSEHKERQQRIKPVEETWEQQLEKWKQEEYKGKEFQENTALIISERGERVRSKSEKILADYFYRNNIPYKYEKPLRLKGVGIVYPDFTFLSPMTREEIYWEHEGMMDDPSYAEQAIKKLNAYVGNGIFIGERLIISFETEKTVLDLRLVKKQLEACGLM